MDSNYFLTRNFLFSMFSLHLAAPPHLSTFPVLLLIKRDARILFTLIANTSLAVIFLSNFPVHFFFRSAALFSFTFTCTRYLFWTVLSLETYARIPLKIIAIIYHFFLLSSFLWRVAEFWVSLISLCCRQED